MAPRALSIQPLITSLQVTSTSKQCSLTDDAGGAGSATQIDRLWNMLSTLGPDFGYIPNSKKRWIIAKPHKKEYVKEFQEKVINIERLIIKGEWPLDTYFFHLKGRASRCVVQWSLILNLLKRTFS